jgi:hypothetical protein
MTDEIAGIALAFCREVLRWKKPEPSGVPFEELVWIKAPGGPRFLRFTDLNAVMAAVRKWRDQTQDALDEYVTVTLSCVSGEFIGHAFIGTAQPTTTTADDPCQAVMGACVEASRKMKAQS